MSSKIKLVRRWLIFCFVTFTGLYPLSVSAEDERIAVVKSLYGAFSQGKMEQAKPLLHSKVVWTFRGQSHVVPYSGTFRGWLGVQDFFLKVGESLNMEVFEPQTFSVSGSVVTVTGIEQAVVRSTGGRYRIKWVQFYTVENGLITRMEEVTDSGSLLEAFSPADPVRGQAYYTACVACHGLNGEGYFAMHAPSLTVLDQDYLIRQLRNFQHKVRGGPQDFYGWMMNGRAIALSSDRAIRDVSAYINRLPDKTDVGGQRVSGSSRNGKKIYKKNCATCHGESGLGVVSMSGPRLAGLQDWYLVEQLNKFRSGIRGANQKDSYGKQMRPFAQSLKDEKSVKDVAAYITSLTNE